jgi:hypothetical protein
MHSSPEKIADTVPLWFMMMSSSVCDAPSDAVWAIRESSRNRSEQRASRKRSCWRAAA